MSDTTTPAGGDFPCCATAAATIAALEATHAAEVLDQAVHFGRGRYLIARVIRTADGRKVQLRVSRAEHPTDSYAQALVLTDRLEWNRLCEASPRYWHGDTPATPMHDDAIVTGTEWLLNELSTRALRILA